MRYALLMGFPLLIACGSDEPIVQRATPPVARQVAAAQAEKTGVVHEIQMVGSVQAGFRFEPAELTIKAGDTVRWINASGFPHNVAFYADSIPRGAASTVDELMPADGKLGSLNGRLLTELGDEFEIDFLNAPSGSYRYFSVPQEAMGMVGTITIEWQ